MGICTGALACLLVGAAPGSPDEVNAASYLQGARQVDPTGKLLEDAWALIDGVPETQFEQRVGKQQPAVIEFAEPYDITRAEVVNSNVEKRYPGIGIKELLLEQAPARNGPWTPLASLKPQQGTAVQSFAVSGKGLRWVRVSLVANHGHVEWLGLGHLGLLGRRSTAKSADFNGAWKTNWGEMVLTQVGERVTGCYGTTANAGLNTVEGTVEGSTFAGTWREESSTSARHGLFALTLTAETALSGVYGRGSSAKDRNKRWDGPHLEKATVACKKPEEAIAAEVRDLAEQGRVVLHGILFDTGKDRLRPESLGLLEALAAAMKQDPTAHYEVEGHTDDRGGDGLNQPLSQRRAATVVKWLGEHGVEPARLTPKGYGASRPTLPNDSDAGRAANRRVEVARLP